MQGFKPEKQGFGGFRLGRSNSQAPFLTLSRGQYGRPKCKDFLWKNKVFAKSDFEIPSRKIVDLGVHFGGQNGSKIDQNGGPNTHRKPIAFH